MIRRITPLPSRKNKRRRNRRIANYKTMLAAYDLMKKKVTTAEASARKAQADADASAAAAKLAAAEF